jgi:hypothetical protein
VAEPAKHFGESVVWRSSKRAWLGRHGGRFCLIAMIDEGSGRVLARFVEENSTPENLDLLGVYVTRFGRPRRIRTHRLSLFRGNPRADAPQSAKDPAAGRSQVRRALAELEIEWVPTELEATAGLACDFFKIAKRDLARALRQAGIRTLAEANRYLDRVYLPAWHDRHATRAKRGDVHRPLLREHDLDAILSEVETRTISDRGSVQFYGGIYLLPESERLSGMSGAQVQVEMRRNGAVYLRTTDGCVPLKQCDPRSPNAVPVKPKKHAPKWRATRPFNRAWMRDFFKQPEPPLWRSLK